MAYIYIFLVSFFLFIFGSNSISIFSLDEAKNASCAREMFERNDIIVPTFNYELRTDKPPVHYWFMMLAYKIFGVNEFSARFFSAVFGSLTVLITFLFSQKFINREVAVMLLFILLSSIHFVFQFHMAVPDPYLIFFLTSAFLSFFTFYKTLRQRYIYIFYVSVGLSILTKGLIGILLPSLIVLTFLLIERNVRFLKDMRLFLGIPLIFTISLPWYIAVGVQTDWVWIKEFLFKHNINRFSDPMEGHGGLFFITFLFVFIGMLPFSIFLPQVIKFVLKEKHNSLIIYLSLIVLIYTGFFAISKTKLPNYTVPVYPPLAILIAMYLYNLDIKRSKIIYNLIFYSLLTLSILVGLYFAVSNDKNLYIIKDYTLYFLILFFGSLIAIYFYFKKDIRKIILSLSASAILMSVFIYGVIMPRIDRESSVKYLMKYIDTTKPIGYYKRYNPAFSFYIKKKIEPLNSIEDVKRFTSDGKVYILTRDEYMNEIKDLNLKVLGKKKDLFENPISVLLTNKE
ncbi:MAG: glycosyltransferase family 39 protein [Hydrogenothermaceae bacterium]